MKKRALTSLLIAVIISTSVAQPELKWASTYNAVGNDQGNDLLVDENGNVYVTGSSDAGNFISDYFTIKYNSSGDTLWTRRFNGLANGIDEAYKIKVDPAGNVYITGKSATSATGFNIVTIKYNASGVQQWIANFDAGNTGSNRDDIGLNMLIDIAGNVYVVGSSYKPGGNQSTGIVIKYNASGIKQWHTHIGTNSYAAKLIAQNTFGNLIVPAGENQNDSPYYIYIINPANGSVLQTYNDNLSPVRGFPEEMALDATGNIYVTSTSYSFCSTPNQVHTAKFSYTPPPQVPLQYSWDYWTFVSCGVSTIEGVGMTIDSDLDLYVLSDFFNSNKHHFHLKKYNPNGGVYWSFTQPSSTDDTPVSLAIGNPSGTIPQLYVTGNTSTGLIKTIQYDADSTWLWSKTYGCGTGIAAAARMVVDDCDNIYITGFSTCNGTFKDILTLKYASPSPAIMPEGPTTFCQGGSVTLTAPVANSYLWNTGATTQSITVSSSGNYSVMVTNANGCSATTPSVLVTVNPVNTPGIIINATATTICQGQNVTFTPTPTNGGPNPSYQWYVNNALVGTASSYSTTTLANGAQVNCVMTSSATCASPTTATSNSITITVNPVVIPGVSISASAINICQGQNVTFTPTPTNGGSNPVYQWYVNNALVGTGATYETTALANGAQVYCIMTSSAVCVSPATATSNSIFITVNPTVTPGVSITASSTTICPDQNITFTAVPANGGTGPTYQWYVNNVLSGTGASYSTTNLSNGAQVYCVMTSNADCINISTATSNTVSITVNQPVTPNVSVNATATTICQGQNVTFTPTPTNGGPNPSYQWYVNNALVGTASSYSTTTLANGAQVNCVMTSSATCASPTTATSNSISITVNPVVIPGVSISASAINICQGQNVTFTPTPTNGGSNPVYQWYVNNALVGTGATYATTALANGAQVSCVMTSNATCASPAIVTSNTIVVTVNPVLTPEVSVSGPQLFCLGEEVTYEAIPTYGGIGPAFQWFVNNVPVDTGATFTSSSLVSGDQIYCILTSNAACVNPATAISPATTLTALALPNVQITANGPTTFCTGGTVTLTATPTGISYVWSTGATTKSITVATAGIYTVEVTANNGCSASSAPTIISVNPLPPPPDISPSGTIQVCEGVEVILTSSFANAYLWNTGETTQSIVITTSGEYSVEIEDANMCTSESDPVIVTVLPNAQPAISLELTCTGNDAVVTAIPVDGGANPLFEWQLNGVNQSTQGPVLQVTNGLPTWLVACQMTSNANCAPDPPVSGQESIVLACIIGTQEPVFPDHFQVIPNPSPGLFTVGFYLPEAKMVRHRVLNVLGQVVWTGATTLASGNYQQQIDLGAEMTPGIYLLETLLDGEAFLWKVAVER